MQRGSLIRSERKRGPAVWQFRWSDKGPDGQRIYRKRVIGTVDEYAGAEAVRYLVKGLIAKPRSGDLRIKPAAMTLAELCQHFQHRELTKDDNWRSYSTRRNYLFCLEGWIIPRWGKYELGNVRTIEVESWLRSLPRARGTCAKIRNVMSVLFNHALRYELFDRNPIRLVRQSAKRRTAPNVLTPAEIKALLDALPARERTLVLLAASTGLRQSELFALQWGDVDLQDRVLAKARASSSDCCQRFGAMEAVLLPPESGGLDICQRTLPGAKTLLGPGDLAQVHTANGTRTRHPKTIWLAHVSPHLLNAAPECWNGI